MTAPAVLVAALAAACGDAGTRRGPPPKPTTVALVDSVPYATELFDGYHRRVAVRVAGRVDTVPGLLVNAPPVVVDDTLLVGLRADADSVIGPFAYSLRTRHLRALPRPADWYAAASPALSPDGRYVAYLARDPGDTTFLGRAAVLELPTGRVLYRGAPTRVLETDAGVDQITWPAADQFEVRIDMHSETNGAVQRTRGTVRPLRVTVDTVHPLLTPR